MIQIYFIRRADGTGPIKIGCTCALRTRLRQLRSDYRASLVVLATVPGDYALERALHIKFEAHRQAPEGLPSRRSPIGGVSEWFAPVPALLAMIDVAKATGVVELDPSERRELVFAERYLAGDTLQSIGDDFGITRERVRQVLRKFDVPTMGHRPWKAGKPEVSDLVTGLTRDGATVAEIRRKTGMAHPTIRRILRLSGVQENPPKAGPRFKPETLALATVVAAEYTAGVKLVEIARRHEITHMSNIYRYLRMAGVQPQRLAA